MNAIGVTSRAKESHKNLSVTHSNSRSTRSSTVGATRPDKIAWNNSYVSMNLAVNWVEQMLKKSICEIWYAEDRQLKRRRNLQLIHTDNSVGIRFVWACGTISKIANPRWDLYKTWKEVLVTYRVATGRGTYRIISRQEGQYMIGTLWTFIIKKEKCRSLLTILAYQTYQYHPNSNSLPKYNSPIIKGHSSELWDVESYAGEFAPFYLILCVARGDIINWIIFRHVYHQNEKTVRN